MRTRYKFSHRAGGRYYWRRRVPGTVYEEVISCNVDWFWRSGPITTYQHHWRREGK